MDEVCNTTLLMLSGQQSMTHNTIENTPISQHPLISRLMKGIYNSRPPEPWYSTTWDVTTVPTWLKGQGAWHSEERSLKDLSGKLAFLDLRFRSYIPEGVLFKLASLTKKRKAGAPLKDYFFTSFAQDSCLCVVQCPKNMKMPRRYTEIQYTGKQACFFPMYVKPHKPVSSQRIAHWIKDTLKKVGVDTSTFTTHSVCGASTSVGKELHISDVLKMADWSRESTFRQFYYWSSVTTEKDYTQKMLNSSDSHDRLGHE